VINWVGGPARYIVDPGIPSADYNSRLSSTNIPAYPEPSNPQLSLSGPYSPPGYLGGVFAYVHVEFTNNGSSQYNITLYLKMYLDGTQKLYFYWDKSVPAGATRRLSIAAFCVANHSQTVSAKTWVYKQGSSYVSHSGEIHALRGYGAVSLAQLCRHLNSRKILTTVSYLYPGYLNPLVVYQYWDGTAMRTPAVTNTPGGVIFAITPSTPTYIFRYGTPAPPAWVVKTEDFLTLYDILCTYYYVMGVT
jgi:hypothetical protein